jgi:hypothetical protein
VKALLLLAVVAGFSPDRQIPGPRLVRRAVQIHLVMGHGVCWWQHPDGSMELGPDRSGVFFAGPRQNWWSDGRHLKKKGKP